VEVFQDGVHTKLCAPLHAGGVHLLGALYIMLPCAQKPPQEVVVCRFTIFQPQTEEISNPAV
jgi:hypothetical protein